jgi:hypothetical protein
MWVWTSKGESFQCCQLRYISKRFILHSEKLFNTRVHSRDICIELAPYIKWKIVQKIVTHDQWERMEFNYWWMILDYEKAFWRVASSFSLLFMYVSTYRSQNRLSQCKVIKCLFFRHVRTLSRVGISRVKALALPRKAIFHKMRRQKVECRVHLIKGDLRLRLL